MQTSVAIRNGYNRSLGSRCFAKLREAAQKYDEVCGAQRQRDPLHSTWGPKFSGSKQGGQARHGEEDGTLIERNQR